MSVHNNARRNRRVAMDSVSLLGLLRKAGVEGDVDFLRESVEALSQAVIELEAAERIGAGKHERTPERVAQRNGYRGRVWDTRVGRVDLKIPKLREGSFFPELLQPRRRSEQALVAVVQEAYVHGVSTRKMDELVKALGLEGISKSEVSRLCQALDESVGRFLSHPLELPVPYIWLDATYLKVREGGRVVSMALVVAVGVRSDGEREILGLDVGPSEDAAFWRSFLRSLVERGLSGVKLVVSDAHVGLKQAIAETLAGASWQRCRVHFMRNLLVQVPKAAQAMVAALVRTIFIQPDQAAAKEHLRKVVTALERRYPKAAALLAEAEEDVLAHLAFPEQHRRRLHSTNPLERLNKEIKRRSNVVGIFPNRAAAIRLVGALLMEQSDEWAVGKRYFSTESMLAAEKGVLDPLMLIADGDVAAS